MVLPLVYRTFLVDGHAVVRGGIKDQLGGWNDWRVVGEAASAADGIAPVAALYVRSSRERALVTGGCV
ncbi:MAG: hypothetical protein H8K08_10865 [Nitrospira sp.]|nr:hypothetical protein [Nitrospira sp.]